MAKQLSKKDIKEVVVGALELFAKAVQNDFAKVSRRFDKVEFELNEVKEEVNEVKKEVREMKENSSALYSKLDRFIVLYEKHEQELAIFGVQLRRLEERLEKLEKRA